MSNQFNKILVPLDAGEISDRALDVAIDMAHKYGAALVAVSVRRDPVDLKDLNQATTVSDLEEVEAEFKSLEERVRRHIATVAPLEDGKVKVEVRAGNVVMAIVDAATENHADLIVMGTHGRMGLVDKLLGSTTERVQRKVTTSVLTVRPKGFPYLRD